MADSDLTNTGLARLVSMETLGAFAASAVLIALSYGALSQDVANIKTSAASDTAKVEQVQSDIADIKTDVEVIKTKLEANQEQYLRQLEQAKRDREASDRKLDAILQRVGSGAGN